MSISNYAEDKILDSVLNNISFAVTTPYVSLHDGDPAETGANEVTGGSYIRKAGSFAAASGGTCSSDAQLEWTNMPACTVDYVGIWDAETTGNFLWGGATTASKTVNAGDTFRIASGDLDVTLD